MVGAWVDEDEEEGNLTVGLCRREIIAAERSVVKK